MPQGPRRSARWSLSTPPWSIPRERQSCEGIESGPRLAAGSAHCQGRSSTRVERRARVDSFGRYPLTRTACCTFAVLVARRARRSRRSRRPRAADQATPSRAPGGAHASCRDQWQPQRSRRATALDVPSPITRDEQVERVSLKQAIAIALENNPGIAAQRLEPRAAGGRHPRRAGAVRSDARGRAPLRARARRRTRTSLAGDATRSVVDDRTRQLPPAEAAPHRARSSRSTS